MLPGKSRLPLLKTMARYYGHKIMLKNIFYTILFFGCFAADRFSKMWAYLNLMTQDKDILPGLRFELAWNRGISWGMLQFDSQNYFWLLTAGIILVTIILAIHTLWCIRQGELIIGEILVLAGACSNLVDRFTYGAVLDFIDLYVGPWHWYTFNVADAWVVIGASVIIYKYLACREGVL